MNEADGSDHDDLRQRLQTQYTELATLAGGLAHEIKNPLSTLNLNLQLLAEDFADVDEPLGPRALRKIEVLQRECLRLEEILDEFLRFAHVTELELAPTNLSELLAEMVEFYRPQAERAHVVIRTDISDQIPTVYLDRNRFKQAMLNLFINAQHAMADGGELMLQGHVENGQVILHVIDTGVGMNDEMLDRAFRPFFSSRPNGSGLGLPTTKRIIQAHHGTLTAKSEPTKGTDFTIRLPLAPPQNAQAPAE